MDRFNKGSLSRAPQKINGVVSAFVYEAIECTLGAQEPAGLEKELHDVQMTASSSLSQRIAHAALVGVLVGRLEQLGASPSRCILHYLL